MLNILIIDRVKTTKEYEHRIFKSIKALSNIIMLL
jgi:hypothetical protein